MRMPPHQPTRRSLLRVGGFGLLGLSFPQFLEAASKARPKASAKAVIFLHQWGGPGQHETFDPKPDAPETVRGWYGATKTKLPGVLFGERIPKLAALADKLTLIRCMQHTMKHHNSAGYYSLTGVAPPTDDQRLRDNHDLAPAYGSIVDRLAPSPPGVPTFVSFPHVIADGPSTPGQQASFLGKEHDPLLLNRDPTRDGFQLPELTLPDNISVERMHDRKSLLNLINGQAERLESALGKSGLDEPHRKAVEMLTSPRFRQTFDLSKESDATRDRYGRTAYGQSCLLARRVVEAGAKFVNVYFARSIGGKGQGWDYHGFDGEKATSRLDELLPMTDQTLPALLMDLEERGMLESTLVVWVGEFGRTPRISALGGRDHWPQCYSAVLAGGGMKKGFVYGASDKLGAYPMVGEAGPEALAATMFEALGIDPNTELIDKLKRPVPIARAKPIREVFA